MKTQEAMAKWACKILDFPYDVLNRVGGWSWNKNQDRLTNICENLMGWWWEIFVSLDSKIRHRLEVLANNIPDIKVGDLFEDCRCHPCRCTKTEFGDVEGISLIDESETACSLSSCGVVKLTEDEAQRIIQNGPEDSEMRRMILNDKANWWEESE